MEIWRIKLVFMVSLIVCCANSIVAQALVSDPAKAQAGAGNTFRLIRDLHTGARWLLERNAGNPAGPGRMVLLNSQDGALFESAIAKRSAPRMSPEVQYPVIRSGDRLVVEENSALVEARLEAVALGPAAEGAEFKVRLEIGGKVVQAVALGPGRAAFAAHLGKR
jgi:hypothetical protein